MAKRGALTHRKTRRLARALGGIPLPYALGIMEALWHATQVHAPDGAIGRLSDASIAEEMWWDEEPARLVQALVDAELLDEHADHRLIVHGWAEHADDATHRALARKREFFADGTPPRYARLEGSERARAAEFYQQADEREKTERAHAGRTECAQSTDSGARNADPGALSAPKDSPRARSPAPPRPAPPCITTPPTPLSGGDGLPGSEIPDQPAEPPDDIEQRLAAVVGRPLIYDRGKERPLGDDVWAEQVEAVWRESKGGRLRRDQVIALLYEHVRDLGAKEVAARLKRYCSEVQGNFATIRRFAETIGDWSATPIAKPERLRSARDIMRDELREKAKAS